MQKSAVGVCNSREKQKHLLKKMAGRIFVLRSRRQNKSGAFGGKGRKDIFRKEGQ